MACTDSAKEFGNLSVEAGQRLVWQVYTHCGDQWFLSNLPTQKEAWVAAVGTAPGERHPAIFGPPRPA